MRERKRDARGAGGLDHAAEAGVAAHGQAARVRLVGLAEEIAVGAFLVALELLAVEVGLADHAGAVAGGAEHPGEGHAVGFENVLVVVDAEVAAVAA